MRASLLLDSNYIDTMNSNIQQDLLDASLAPLWFIN